MDREVEKIGGKQGRRGFILHGIVSKNMDLQRVMKICFSINQKSMCVGVKIKNPAKVWNTWQDDWI